MTQLDRLPVRITPARIRESIVQVYFNSDIPIEPLVGYLYSVLGQEFGMSYSNIPVTLPKNQSVDQGASEGISIQLGPRYFFYDDNIKIFLDQQGSLVFNCMNDYPGWNKYGAIIKSVIKSLMEKKIIKSIHQIGIRYISEFANIDLLDKLKFEFKLGAVANGFNTCNFGISWNAVPFIINLNLQNKLSAKPVLYHPEHQQIDFISLIDVDAIIKDKKFEYFEDFQEALDSTHQKEKEVFFSLLRNDFLATLNPEYT